jgi:endoglucanase
MLRARSFFVPIALALSVAACGGDDGSSGGTGATGGTGGQSGSGATGGTGATGGSAGSSGTGATGGSAGAGGASGSGGAAGSAGTPHFAGVNLSCAEFGDQSLPGNFGTDYTYPTQSEVDYFMGKGMNVFRLPFRWERLQQQANQAFDSAELGRLHGFVDPTTQKGGYVILDPHNYARYFGDLVGDNVPASAFADFWQRLADEFKADDHVIFGLMNEPHDMQTETWRDDANAAIAAIRGAGATNLIFVPGNAWTGAWTWTQSFYGTANGDAMLSITDPGNHYAFEVHQYLDQDGSGTSGTCVSDTIGAERLADFTAWAKAHGVRAFLGEMGAASNATCDSAVDGLLDALDADPDVWLGWTWWAAGPWWGNYMYSIEPNGGNDAPQMTILAKHLPP